MKICLIQDWRVAWRFWSLRLNALGTLLLGWFLLVPESMLTLWGFLPPEARAILPPRAAMAAPLIMFVLATLARLVKQERLNAQQQPAR